MAERKLMLALAKLMIAAAWADGDVNHDEVTALKLLLLRLKSAGFARGIELSGREWAELNIYIDSPIDSSERQRLLVDLQNSLRTRKDQELAISALQEVMAADGEISKGEQAVLDEMAAAIKSTTVGVIGFMGGLFRQRIRSEAADKAPNRERYFRDYLRNRVYFSLRQRQKEGSPEINLNDNEMRRLGLAGALMAKVAHIDGKLGDAEQVEMAKLIQSHWSLSRDAAHFVAEVAGSALDKTFDMTYIMHELSRSASEKERRAIVHAMFAVAAADGRISEDELSTIRFITYGINLTHHDYIDAKTAVVE